MFPAPDENLLSQVTLNVTLTDEENRRVARITLSATAARFPCRPLLGADQRHLAAGGTHGNFGSFKMRPLCVSTARTVAARSGFTSLTTTKTRTDAPPHAELTPHALPQLSRHFGAPC